MSESFADTTLMMVTYNRLDLTKRMLDHLFTVDPYRKYNLAIVDNGSTDGTVNYLKELQADHEMIRAEGGTCYSRVSRIDVTYLPENKGIAIGRNIGLKMADELGTKWYCTVDNDVEMPKCWLQECVDILHANRGYGGVGVNMEDKPYRQVTKNGHTFQDKPQGNLGTACMVFPKSVHSLLGFFNTEYGPYGEEDADFGMRVRVAGMKLGYIARMGNHFGVGAADEGEYREYKTACHKKNLKLFNKNVREYMSRKKPLYISLKT